MPDDGFFDPFSPEAKAAGARRSALEKAILPKLIGRLWHTTSPDLFEGIQKSGAIVPDPAIPDSMRSKSYVRRIGGVSLFDFEGFDPETHSGNDWAYFIPYQSRWDCAAVWIEIDPEKIASQFISGRDLLRRWKAEDARDRIMAYIEAAHLGAIPVDAFKQALLVSKDDANIQSLDLPN